MVVVVLFWALSLTHIHIHIHIHSHSHPSYNCRGRLLPKLLLTAALVAGGAYAYKTYQDKQGEKKEDPKKKNGGGGGGGLFGKK